MKHAESLKLLRAKTAKELLGQLGSSSKELTKLRFDASLGKTSAIKPIRLLKHEIARTETILNEKIRQFKKTEQ